MKQFIWTFLVMASSGLLEMAPAQGGMQVKNIRVCRTHFVQVGVPNFRIEIFARPDRTFVAELYFICKGCKTQPKVIELDLVKMDKQNHRFSGNDFYLQVDPETSIVLPGQYDGYFTHRKIRVGDAIPVVCNPPAIRSANESKSLFYMH